MKQGEIKTTDWLAANTLGFLSHTALRIVAGINKPPRPPDARWSYAKISAQSVKNWQEFTGREQAGSLPKGYDLDALISIDKVILDEYQKFYGGHQAVVYALGTAVMVGTVNSPNFLGYDPGDNTRYAALMGIGKGVLRAALAICTDERKTIVPPDGMGGRLIMPESAQIDGVPTM